MDLTDIRQIRELLGRHGFHFSRSMGQNFLCAAWVPERIADSAALDGDTGVLEVGPGIGCLTAELAKRAKKVVSLELDKALQPVLAETLAGLGNVEVVFGDVMKTDLAALCAEKFADCARTVVCANLPYNITSPLLTAFTDCACFDCVTVMIQREVAQRICAASDTSEYGAFTLLMQWHTVPERLFDVPPNCFIPAPKVTSSVVRMERRSAPPCAVKSEDKMFSLIRAAFLQRRKTLCNAMMHGLGLSRETASAAIAACGLPPTIRGEALSMAQFAALSDALEEAAARN